MQKTTDATMALNISPCTGSIGGRRGSRAKSKTSPKLHRVATVRQEQDVSLRSAARRSGWSLSQVGALEDETRDLNISDLLRWQQVLEVPLHDLLSDPGASLSAPVMRRAQMLRLMKSVTSLAENVKSERSQRLVTMMRQQLVEIMPELEQVTAWPSVGQRRSADELGRAAERSFGDEFFA